MNYSVEITRLHDPENKRTIHNITAASPPEAHKIVYINYLESNEEITKILTQDNEVVFESGVGFTK